MCTEHKQTRRPRQTNKQTKNYFGIGIINAQVFKFLLELCGVVEHFIYIMYDGTFIHIFLLLFNLSSAISLIFIFISPLVFVCESERMFIIYRLMQFALQMKNRKALCKPELVACWANTQTFPCTCILFAFRSVYLLHYRIFW